MSTGPTNVESTITFLFDELHLHEIPYVVLRNHEGLPSLRHSDGSGDITDIDLVIDTRHLLQWRSILKRASEMYDWDVVTECFHWTQSSCPAHHIQVFRFYRLDPLQFIQIDIFHSYLVLGLPIINEQDLLKTPNRNRHGILCADQRIEAFHVIMKVHWSTKANSPNKIKRYRNRALELWRNPAVRSYIHQTLGAPGVEAFRSVERNDFQGCSKHVERARRLAFRRHLFSHPVSGLRHIIVRREENVKRYTTGACGRIVNVYATGETARNMFRETLDTFCRCTIFEEWKELSKPGIITRSERSVMEQGGFIVLWCEPDKAHLIVDSASSPESVARSLIELAAAQDSILFRRPSPQEYTSGDAPSKETPFAVVR